jgi:para-nitrobenzyl esterase
MTETTRLGRFGWTAVALAAAVLATPVAALALAGPVHTATGTITGVELGPQKDVTVFRAISQSAYETNEPHLRERWYGRPSLEDQGVALASKVGCGNDSETLGKLRAVTADEILANSGDRYAFTGREGFRTWPVVDGWLLPDAPMTLFEAGQQHDVPLIVGSNADEMAIFPMPEAKGASAAAYRLFVGATFPRHVDEVTAIFPAAGPAQVERAVVELLTVYNFTAAARGYARGMRGVPANAYLYVFTRVPPFARGKGAYHALEIPYVFNRLRRSRLADISADSADTFEEADQRLSDAMASYWVRFAATGDPNLERLPAWPVYTAENDAYLELGTTIAVGRSYRSERCDLIDRIRRETPRLPPE